MSVEWKWNGYNHSTQVRAQTPDVWDTYTNCDFKQEPWPLECDSVFKHHSCDIFFCSLLVALRRSWIPSQNAICTDNQENLTRSTATAGMQPPDWCDRLPQL